MWRSENYIINTTTGKLEQDKEIGAISTVLVLLMAKVTTFPPISLRYYFYNFIHLKKSDAVMKVSLNYPNIDTIQG